MTCLTALFAHLKRNTTFDIHFKIRTYYLYFMYKMTIGKVFFRNASTLTYFQNNGTERISNPFDNTL